VRIIFKWELLILIFYLISNGLYLIDI